MTPEEVLKLLVDAINSDGGVYIDHIEDEGENGVGVVEIIPCFGGMTELGEAYVQACIVLGAPIVAIIPYALKRELIEPEQALALCKLPRRK